jgi:hypothetical protein
VQAVEGRNVDAFTARSGPAPAARVHPSAQPVLTDRPPSVSTTASASCLGRTATGCGRGRATLGIGRLSSAPIAEALKALPVSSVILDGEAVAHCDKGLPDFHGLLGDGASSACFYAFDLLAIDGFDVRHLTTSKAASAALFFSADGQSCGRDVGHAATRDSLLKTSPPLAVLGRRVRASKKRS